MIKRVHHLMNDTVMVFGDKGLLYQGKFERIIEEIKQDANGSTKFYVEGLIFPVNRELFFSKDYYNFIKNRRI